jgi:hypothetical protein
MSSIICIKNVKRPIFKNYYKKIAGALENNMRTEGYHFLPVKQYAVRTALNTVVCELPCLLCDMPGIILHKKV